MNAGNVKETGSKFLHTSPVYQVLRGTQPSPGEATLQSLAVSIFPRSVLPCVPLDPPKLLSGQYY